MYRVLRNGVTVECDSAAEALSLLAGFESVVSSVTYHVTPELVKKPRGKKRPVKRAKRRSAKPRVVKPRVVPAARVLFSAGARRDEIVAEIRKAEFGLTRGELKRTFKTLTVSELGNALSVLRTSGAIRRLGNVWKANE